MKTLLNIIVDVQEKLQLIGTESFEKYFGKVAFLRFDTSYTTARAVDSS